MPKGVLKLFLAISGSPRADGLSKARAQVFYPGGFISLGGFIWKGFL
jgi:hypothetical protein